MIRSLYSAATGMRAQQFNVDVVSNNLANVNTNGFKRSKGEFEDLFYEHFTTPGSPSNQASEHPTGISVGMGVRTGGTARSHAQGNARNTENSLDLMIKGDGMFQILKPDGTTAYTRDGSFALDGDGRIVNSSGHFLQPEVQVPADATSIDIRADGTISAQMPGEAEAQEVGQIELARFANPAGLKAEGSNLYNETTASGAPQVSIPGQDGAGEVQQGFLEKANVDVIKSLTDLISMQRAYEFNHRTIKTSDRMLQRATTLLQ
ncbi:MAG: flagellar basal-body rod protein FlgG [bacterium]